MRSTLIRLGISYYFVFPIEFCINFRMINQILKGLCMSNSTIVGSDCLSRVSAMTTYAIYSLSVRSTLYSVYPTKFFNYFNWDAFK